MSDDREWWDFEICAWIADMCDLWDWHLMDIAAIIYWNTS